ncbi:ABC transporter substrate-binding protein [Yinghuangia sp. ASG 101]|uniref:ABC transporter substrate-binding protein n=1 Tax=Yinghuangia sp. ASG 101 TaxID=2896848 RepID=UPI001E3738E4|nr:ABC transporter substrate-binding protein [Yinghuangia sp. ASG 101]UGQ11615.1 ABC transporter substrate-binding protein [Yinghuangia sp. ASG 101]
MRALWVRSSIAAAAAFSLAACAGGAGSSGSGGPNGIRVLVTPGTVWSVPLQAAKDQGYFDQAGVNVSVDEVSGGMGASQLLASNSEEFGVASPSQALAAIQGGQDMVVGCGANTATPTSLVAPKGSSLPSVASGASPEDVLRALKGKSIGIPAAVGTGTANLMAKTLAGAGLKDGDYTLVNIGTGAAAQAAIISKRVDAAMAVTPTVEPMITDGVATELVELSETVPDYQLIGAVWVAKSSWVKSHQEAAAGFCKAIGQAYAYLQDPANADAVDKLVSKAVGSNVSDEAVDAIRANFTVLTAEVPRESMDKTIATLTDIGVLKADPAVTYDQAVQIAK